MHTVVISEIIINEKRDLFLDSLTFILLIVFKTRELCKLKLNFKIGKNNKFIPLYLSRFLYKCTNFECK